MKNVIIASLILPFAAGLISFITPKQLKKIPAVLATVVSSVTLGLCCMIFKFKPALIYYKSIGLFWVDNLSAFITLFIGLFGFLIVIYSLGFMRKSENLNKYYAYILWTISASIGAAISNHLILFVTFWGMLGITLYLLIAMGTEGSAGSAKKTFIIIGGSDAVILLGIAILWKISPSLEMSVMQLAVNSQLATLAFICLVLGAFAKAGAMPLHTWIPDSAETAPTPVMAFLPASLDKLLGIYFLFRISVNIFKIQPNSAMSLFLMIIGSITIIAAVMMALVQHNLKKLLSYHAVSQVGYMILGIGTANPIGIAGGLFHMLNNAIYKSCLFLSGGNVEHRTGTNDLSKLGGLIKVMPYTFVAFLIASFAISGIPPFNGFVSKWMVYQGIIELGKTGTKLWPIWLTAAMFGSALTLASFMKLIHAIFLGQPSSEKMNKIKRAPVLMIIVPLVLAVLCVVFGIFAYQIPIRLFIAPSMQTGISYSGAWDASMATTLIVVGLVIGFVLYLLGTLKSREAIPFIGGEVLDKDADMRTSGVDFYTTVSDISILKKIYGLAEKKYFDLYEMLKKIFGYATEMLRAVHTGVLLTYMMWVLVGFAILLYIFR
ncbi:NADH-quinone oxidoreductase subunit L [Thermoproteota archaeon]